jgi:hypothetical protein
MVSWLPTYVKEKMNVIHIYKYLYIGEHDKLLIFAKADMYIDINICI